MTLNDVEESLGVKLPEYYKEFIKQFPKALLAEGFHACEVELINSPDRLIELNELVRGIQDIDLDASYFLIGESGCGDYYFIDIDDEDSPVYFWNHDIADFDDEEESASLEEHAGKILKVYKYVTQNT